MEREIRCPACGRSCYVAIWDGEYLCICGEVFSEDESPRLLGLVGKASKHLLNTRRESKKLPPIIKSAPKGLALLKGSERLLSTAPRVVKLLNLFI